MNRRVKYYEWEFKNNTEDNRKLVGYACFHQFSSDGQSAIIELDTGEVRNIDVELIRFVDKESEV